MKKPLLLLALLFLSHEVQASPSSALTGRRRVVKSIASQAVGRFVLSSLRHTSNTKKDFDKMTQEQLLEAMEGSIYAIKKEGILFASKKGYPKTARVFTEEFLGNIEQDMRRTSLHYIPQHVWNKAWFGLNIIIGSCVLYRLGATFCIIWRMKFPKIEKEETV